MVKEELSEGVVVIDVTNLSCQNAFEKLKEEQVDKICKIMNNEMRNCNVKHLNPKNEKIGYPTLDILCKTILKTERFPKLEYTNIQRIDTGNGY